MSVVFATELGFNPRLAETDILVSNTETIWFMGVYGIIIANMFKYIQDLLRKER